MVTEVFYNYRMSGDDRSNFVDIPQFQIKTKIHTKLCWGEKSASKLKKSGDLEENSKWEMDQ